MSVFKGHEDLSLNRYYYSFYSFSQSDPYTIKSFVYDQNQTLIFAKDISFNSRNVPAMLTFLENTQSNPYALGKSNDEYLNMDIAFAGLYKKALSQRQQRTLMTFVNNTYKNVYYGTVEKYIVTIVDNGGTPVVYFNGDTSDPNPLAIIHSNGLYIFDQSDPSNTNYPLEFRAIDTQNPYTTNVIIEGTPGTPNSYSVITVDNTTPTNLEYYINSTEPDVGTMKGDLFMGVYVVKTVENWASQTVFTIKAPFQDVYYDQPDLSFNSGDIAYFYVGDTTMTDFSLVFGPTLDSFDSTFYSSYVSKSGNVLTLDLSNTSYPVDASGVYYFEDTSAGMGYVETQSLAHSPSIIHIKSDDGDLTGTTLKNHISNSYGDASIVGTVSIDTSVKTVGTGSLKITGGSTNYVNLPNVTTIPQNFSISFWLKVATPADYGGEYLWYYHNTNYHNSEGFGMKLENVSGASKLIFYVKDIQKFDVAYNNPGNWHHICFVFNIFGVGEYANVYNIAYYIDNSKNTNNHYYAKHGVDYNYHWFGQNPDEVYLDDYQFYDYALSDSNVSDIFTNKNPQSVTVANGVFVIDGLSKPEITFTNGQTYIFDQSDPSNASYPIVFGTSPESSTLYTTGVSVVGTPGQPGAYTKLVYNDTTGALYYYNNIIPGMGYAPNTISYYITVAGTPPKFYLNSVQQPISFTANTKYYFYQSDSTNVGYPIVFGTVEDTEPYFTDDVTEVGTRGQSGAYTILDLSAGFTGPLVYFSSEATEMGFAEPYTVKVVQNWAGDYVFSIQAPGEDLYYNQPDLSFNAGDSAFFDVGDSSMTGYSLVFGTEIDVFSTKLGSPYVSQIGTLINLNLPSDYTGGAVYYFEDTSAGMGYVEAPVSGVYKIVELQSNGTFALTSGSADLSYCAIGGGGAGGYGGLNFSDKSRGGDGGDGGQVIYGDYTFKNSINYTITIGPGGIGEYTLADGTSKTNTNGSPTSITYSSSGSQIIIVDALGGNRGGYGGNGSASNYISPIPIDISYSASGAQAATTKSDTPLPGQDGTGPFNYGAGGGAGASADSGSNKNSQGGKYGGGEGGDINDSPDAATTRPGKDADANTGSGGGGAAGNGGSPRYYGGNGGSGVVVINVETNSYSFTGSYNEIIDREFIVNPYTVSVSGEEFYIDSGDGAKRRPYIIFNDRESYVFDQSNESNDGYPIVFGVTKDSTPYYTSDVTVVGSPGQPGAYTRLDYTGSTPLYYFSSGAINMGSFEPYTVKVVQNWAGDNVFSIQAPGEDLFYNQPDLSFNAGDSALFDVGDSSMTGYNLVFGTEIDVSNTILDSPYVSQSGTLIGLNLPSDYTGGTVYYFENTNTGMGYVEVVAVVEHKIVELQSDGDFTLTFGSADLSYCAIGGGGSGGQGHFGGGSDSRGGNGGNGGQVIDGDYTFENSINYTITIGAGGNNTNGSATSISSGGSQIVNAPGGLKGANGGGNVVASVTVVANSSTGAQAVNNYLDTPSPGQDGTGPFNYGAGGGAGASANTGTSNKSSIGGNYGGGDGGDLTDSPDAATTRPGKDAVANTGSGGGGGSGNGASSPQYDGGHGGSGVVVIYAKTKSYSFTGSYNERTENVDVIVNPHTVTVSNDVFFIDTGSGAQSKPNITFTDGESYVFDQSNESNDGYPIVFGTTADDTSTLYTDGVTIVGTPGQHGAYTRIDYTGSTTLYYFSSGAINMGYDDPYYETDYDIKSGMTFAGVSGTEPNNRTWIQSGGNPSFTNGTYTVSYPSSGHNGSNCELLFTSNSNIAYYAQAYYNNGIAYETAVSGKEFAVTTASSQNYYGSYVQITLPYKLVLKQINIVGQISGSLDLRPRTPYMVYLFGSNDDGTTFTYLGQEDFPYPSINANATSIPITTITTGYYTIRMVINKTQRQRSGTDDTSNYGNAATALSQWHLTGDVLKE